MRKNKVKCKDANKLSNEMKSKKLSDIKSTGHKVPKDYFANFDGRLMKTLQKENLSDINVPGFIVPKDYFISTEKQILAKIDKEETPVIKLSIRRNLYYVVGIAAALVIALAVYFNKNNASTISVEMVETYFQNSGINSYELAELLDDANLLEEDFNLLETNYNEDNLELYLLEHADLESFID